MRRNQVAVVGAAETTELGVIPNMSQIQLHADAALNAIADAGLKLSDIDGFATAVETPQQMAHYLGITPTWVDGTSVGGCSFMLHVRHAAAAIEAGNDIRTALVCFGVDSSHGYERTHVHALRSLAELVALYMQSEVTFERDRHAMGPLTGFPHQKTEPAEAAE